MFKLIPFLILLPFFSSIGQTFKLKGVVRDFESSIQLEYSSIQNLNMGNSTFSNSIGEFELSVNYGDTIKFSFIGYKSKVIKIAKINFLDVKLEKEIFELNPVVISPDTVYRIVEKAFKNIKKNYPTSKYYREAFYREYVKNDNKYVRLIEAAVSEIDYGFQKPYEKQRLKVNEIRKSVDNIQRSWQSKLVTFLFGKTNSLIVSKYNGDFVRKYIRESKLSPKDDKAFEKYFEFKFAGVTKFEGKDIYKINVFLPPERDIGQFEGIIYINSDDYGIVRFAYSWGTPSSFKNSENKNQKILSLGYLTSYDAYYQKIGKKYYLSRIKSVYPCNFDGIDQDSLTGFQFFHTDFITVKLITKKKDMEKIKNKETISRGMDLYDSNIEYNQSFWETYPILLENPINHQAHIDLKKDF